MPNAKGTLVAVAVVQQGECVLIGRRAPGVVLAGYWEFPGGKVHCGETPEQAARRECFEEAGLEIRVERLLCQVAHPVATGRLKLRFYSATPLAGAGAPREPFRWVPIAELNQYEMPPANRRVLSLLGESEG